MPIITIDGPENVSKETKKEIIENISKIVADIYGFPIESIVLSFREIPSDNVGVGGKQLSEKQ